MKIDPKHLVAVEVIRREAGLTKAAAALGTSQPALSRTIADLEIRLGAPLFDRRTRPWALTRLGEGLAQQGATVLRAQDRASQEFDEFRRGGTGTLRIAGTPYFTDGAIAEFLPDFRARFPDVSVELFYGYAGTLRDAVRSGRADLAIYPLGISDVPDDLSFTRLLDARNVIACREGHPILRLAYPRPLALLDYGWVTPPEGSPLAADMVSILSELDMHDARIVLSGGALASVLSYIANSDCLTVLPEATVLAIGRRFGLREVPIATRTPHRPLGILSRPSPELGYAAQAFIGFLGEALERLTAEAEPQ